MSRIRSWGRYEVDEVRVLVEEYATLVGLDRRPGIFVRLLDLRRALARMTRPERDALLLVGVMDLPGPDAGAVLGVSPRVIRRRYEGALLSLTARMNGGAT